MIAIAIGALALGVRAWNLDGQSVTIDEVFEFKQVQLGVPEILKAHDGFPPLYQLLLKGWIALFGNDGARWLSVLCGMLALPVIWRIGHMAGGRETAWLATFLTAISPIHVWYSQEARANALFYLLALLAVCLFFNAMTRNRARDWAIYALSAVVGLYTHYYFTLVMAALFATVPLFPGVRARLGPLIGTHLAIAVAALPWLWLLGPDLQLQSGYGVLRQTLDLKTLGYTLVTFLFGYNVGPSPYELHISRGRDVLLEAAPWGISAGVICMLAVWPLLGAPSARRWALRLGIVLTVPIAACGAAAFLFDLGYRVRYLAWGASILSVLLALGITRSRPSAGSLIAAVVLVGVSAFSLANRNLNPRYGNEDTRAVAQYIATNQLQSNPIFVASGYMKHPVAHYLGDERRLWELPNAPQSGLPTAALEVIRKEAPSGSRFWLIYSRPWDGDPRGGLREELQRVADLELIAKWSGVELYRGRGW